MKEEFSDAVASYTVNLTAHADRIAEETLVLECELLRRQNRNAVIVSAQESSRRAIVDNLVRKIVSGESKGLGESQVFMLTQESPVDSRSIGGLLQQLEQIPRAILYIDSQKLMTDEDSGRLEPFKPFLARGTLSFIFGVTPQDYISTILQDPALARRLPAIVVGGRAPG